MVEFDLAASFTASFAFGSLSYSYSSLNITAGSLMLSLTVFSTLTVIMTAARKGILDCKTQIIKSRKAEMNASPEVFIFNLVGCAELECLSWNTIYYAENSTSK